MSGSVNSNIPLGYNPQPLGPNLGASITQAQAFMAAQQQAAEVARQNKLRNVLGAPGALDPTGQPTPDTMSAVMSIDPNAGMKLRQNALATTQQQLQIQGLRGKAVADEIDLVHNAYAPGLATYDEEIASGKVTPQQAAQNLNNFWAKTTADLRTNGALPPDRAAALRTQVTPLEARQALATTGGYLAARREQDARKREDAAAQKTGNANELQGKLADGTNVLIHENLPAGDPNRVVDLITGKPVPQEKLGGVTGIGKVGAAGAKPEDVTIDGQRGQAIWTGTQWRDLEGNPISGNVSRVSRAPAPEGRQSGMTSDAIKTAADYFRRTGQMPFGIGGKEDREAVLNKIAEEDRTAGRSSDELASGVETGKADTASLRRTTMQRDAISGFEKGATREFDLAQSLIPKSPEPLNMQLLTSWVRSGEKQFGDVPNAQFYVALTSALDEYAKVISGATSSAAASTDSARAQAVSLIPPGATTAQIKGIIGTIKAGMANREVGYSEQIRDIQKRLGGKGEAPPTGGPATVPPDAGPLPNQPNFGSKATDQDRRLYPALKTPADLKNFEPGTPFIRPDGVIGAVPNRDGTPWHAGQGPAPAPAAQPTSLAPPKPSPAAQPPATVPSAPTPPPQQAAPPKAAAPIPLTAGMKPDDLVDGQVYQTARGAAKWDKAQKKFFPVGGQ